LSSGLGNRGSQLSSIEAALTNETRVCSYDRAGFGGSDRAATPQTLTDVVEDLHVFLDQGNIAPPYVLVGQSVGGNIVYRYAQTHSDTVTGFVAMNPVPPYSSWIANAPFDTAEEKHAEIEFFEGANDEQLDLRDTDLMVDEPTPDDLRYVIMFSPEDCPPKACSVLAEATEEVAHHGSQGTFVAVPGAGHEIWLTNLDDIVTEIHTLLG
jgi:pimeloyl-ACP methyl ester carboxylesterase